MRLKFVEPAIAGEAAQPFADQLQCIAAMAVLQQGFGIAVDQRSVIGKAFQGCLVLAEGALRIGGSLDQRTQVFDNCVGRRDFAQPRQFLLGARGLLGAQQGRCQAVAAGGFAAVFLFAQRFLEVGDCLLRRPFVCAQFSAYQLKFQAVGNLARGLGFQAVLQVGNTFAGDRVSTQVFRRVIFVQAVEFLQPFEERSRAARVEPGLGQRLQANAVGLALVLAGEIELGLDRSRLCSRHGGIGNLRIGTRSQDRHRQRGE